jgi:hypothetical protein
MLITAFVTWKTETKMSRWSPRARMPVDFSPLLSFEHVPLLQETPLLELLGALKRHTRIEPVSEARFQRTVKDGLEATNTHLSSDNKKLYDFDNDWNQGSLFTTKKGVQAALNRTTTMWFEADRCLEITAELKETTLRGDERGLIDGSATSTLAESNLNLATKVLTELKKLA